MLIIIFILGAACISFATCHATRYCFQIPNSKWSVCDHCYTRLKWWQLLPILGYLIQKGKCINCKFPISIWYLIYELIGGIFFIYLFNIFPFYFAIQLYFFLTWLLILAFEDFYTETVQFELLIYGISGCLLIFFNRITHLPLAQIEFWLIINCCFIILSLNHYLGWADTFLISLFALLFPLITFSKIILIASLGALVTLKLFHQTTVPFIPWLLIGIIIILILRI